MQIQNSFLHDQPGKLYVVPTPIGNLDDMTFRAVDVLKKADRIAAEDTRHTKKLLNHFDIHTPLISYHEHNKKERERELIASVRQGEELALVSDAGMPGISDPGTDLVQAMIHEGLDVVVLPGANAALCALVGSGLPTDEFLFYGFLPRKKSERKEELERLVQLKATLLFHESPYRVKEMLESVQEVFGEETKITLARELTKRFEQYMRGTVSEALVWLEKEKVRGEFVVVVEGIELKVQDEDVPSWSHLTKKEHVDSLVESGLSRKDAIQKVSDLRGISRRVVYQAYHEK